MNKKQSTIIDHVAIDFFDSYSIVNLELSESHSFYDSTINIGYSDSGDLEALFHEMAHLIYATPRQAFAETNWGYKSNYNGEFNGRWFENVIDLEVKVMVLAYALLDHYQVEDWILSYEDYAETLSDGLYNSISSFLSNEENAFQEIVEDYDDIHGYIYDKLLNALNSYNFSFKEIKTMWHNKCQELKALRGEI